MGHPALVTEVEATQRLVMSGRLDPHCAIRERSASVEDGSGNFIFPDRRARIPRKPIITIPMSK